MYDIFGDGMDYEEAMYDEPVSDGGYSTSHGKSSNTRRLGT